MVINLFVSVSVYGIPGTFFTAFPSGFVLGVFIGQLNLISIWAAISRGNLIVRLPWALLLVALMCSSFWAGGEMAEDAYGHSIYLQNQLLRTSIMLAAGCILTQIPLWIASRLGGWELARPSSSTNDGQFELKQLFLGTTLLAFTLGLARLFFDHDESRFSIAHIYELANIFFFAGALCNLILVTPCVWAAFRLRFTMARFWIAFAVAFIVSMIQYGGICMIIGGPGRDHVKWGIIFVAVNFGQMVVVYSCLSLLRSVGGFRLWRHGIHKELR